jgi:hypothetical protein
MGVTYQANGNLCERRFEALVHRLVDEVLVHLFNAGARLREEKRAGMARKAVRVRVSDDDCGCAWTSARDLWHTPLDIALLWIVRDVAYQASVHRAATKGRRE